MNKNFYLKPILFTIPLLLSAPGVLFALDENSSSTLKKRIDRPVIIAAKPSSSKSEGGDKQSQIVQSEGKMPSTTYTPPKGMGRPWPTQGGGTRGTASCNPTLAVLAPHDHTGLTLDEQPTLYWYISEVCHEAFEVTITEEDAIAPLLEYRLPAPSNPGIQKIRLRDLNLHLEVGKQYQWSIALIMDPAHRSKDIVAIGGIARVSHSSEQGNQFVQGGTTEVTEKFLKAGLWYDAVGSISEKIELEPSQELSTQRALLLKQVHLGKIELN